MTWFPVTSGQVVVEHTGPFTAFGGTNGCVPPQVPPVERELVLRLASLLWRLRRVIAIETDLFQIQAEILRDRRNTVTTAHGEHPDRPPEILTLASGAPLSPRELTHCFL